MHPFGVKQKGNFLQIIIVCLKNGHKKGIPIFGTPSIFNY